MSQWVLLFALLVSGVGIVAWLLLTRPGASGPLRRVRLPAWAERWRVRLPGGTPTGGGGLALLTRRILDEVVDKGDRTMRDRMKILPHEVVVHAAPPDADLLNRHRQVVERDVSAAISASGERERWVSAGPLRIVEIIIDPAINSGWPLVQRAPVDHRADARRTPPSTRPLPPTFEERPPRGGYELARLGGDDPVRVPDGGGTIGRDPRRCAVVVTGSTVSREHARLVPVRDGFRVQDLRSANGISVNGSRTQEGLLRAGDVLGLGRSVRLELRRVEPGATRPDGV